MYARRGARPSTVGHRNRHDASRCVERLAGYDGASAVVAEAHDLLLDQLRTLIEEALDGIALGERDVIGDLVIAAFEGANQPGYHGTSATDLVAAILERASRPVNEHTK
ncbi:hypothetical protein [Streptomyces griseorubiginosus]|uniref:hypothetical protein n=1 Tax=Streptomyces griseorubiginosus TaxID=67304 RepID=UPI0036B3E8BA